MIQDIAPRHLDNQYRNITPDAKDTIFFLKEIQFWHHKTVTA